MRRYVGPFFVCCLLVSALVFLMHRGSDPKSTTWHSNRKADGDLIFIGDSREVFHEKMTDEEADVPLNKFLSRRHVACEKSIRLGNVGDGGWDMCIAGPYHPKQPCLVYSFGINNDFSFDDAVGNTFGCTVRSFDPSMKTKDHQRNAHVWFYQIGIGGKDALASNGWQIKTLSSVVAQFNDSKKIIDYLKMDVEESEYASLDEMLSSGILSQVKQLALELHIEDANFRKVTLSLYERYRLLKRLEDAGFRRWYYAINLYNIKFRPNGVRSCCYEMVYVNMNFLTDSDYTVGKTV